MFWILIISFLLGCVRNKSLEDESLSEQSQEEQKTGETKENKLKIQEGGSLVEYKTSSEKSCKEYVIWNPAGLSVKGFLDIPQNPLTQAGENLSYGEKVKILEKKNDYQKVQTSGNKNVWVRSKWLNCSEKTESIQTQADRVIQVERSPEKLLKCRLQGNGKIPCVYKEFTLLELDSGKEYTFFEKTESFRDEVHYEYGEKPYCYVSKKFVNSCQNGETLNQSK